MLIGYDPTPNVVTDYFTKPAASLEDDDDVLADGTMCHPERWPEVREKVLHGWQHCSDGRLYHPVVAERASEAKGIAT